MTDEEIEIQITVDVDAADYRRALWQHSRRTFLIGIPILAVFVGLAICLIVFALLDGNAIPSLLWYLALGLPPLAICCLTIVLLYVNYRKQARQLAGLNEETKIVFTTTEFIANSQSSSGKTLYTKFAKVHESPLDFIFYQQDKVFFPVPKRFFKDAADIIRLRQILTDALGNTAKMLSSERK